MARRGGGGTDFTTELNNFFNAFNGFQGMLSAFDRREMNSHNLDMMRAQAPYQLGQVQQNLRTQQIQNQLYDSLLNGQINMEDYATAMDTFGVSPQQRVDNYRRRQKDDLTMQLQMARLADLQYQAELRKGRSANPMGNSHRIPSRPASRYSKRASVGPSVKPPAIPLMRGH